MEFIIITGLSGAGKSKAVNTLEDIGFYCIDNIPPEIIHVFFELCRQSKNNIKKVAIVTDIRGQNKFNNLIKSLQEMKIKDYAYKILFLDARNHILINRYKETRRRHPLAERFDSIEQAIKYEREFLMQIKQVSNYVIDTSFTTPNQLRERILDIFLNNENSALVVNCISFGFKYGIPEEADIIFDVRCLPNPFYIKDLRELTGLDKPVKDYVMSFTQTKEFLKRFLSLIDYMLPLYEKEGKNELTICIGCTGGKHRSVVLAQLLHEHFLLKKQKPSIIVHRDKNLT